jgi:selenide,water dikinase
VARRIEQAASRRSIALHLRCRVTGRELERFRPQRDFLSLLNLGDGTALGHKWGVVFAGRWVMSRKDRIDRAFMSRYRA